MTEKIHDKVEGPALVKNRKSGESRTKVEAQREYVKKWNAKQTQIAIRVPPEFKQNLDAYLDSIGARKGLTQFIVDAVNEKIARDSQT